MYLCVDPDVLRYTLFEAVFVFFVFQPGEEFYRENCELKCKCEPPFVTCSAFNCPPMHECEIQDGVQGCYPSGKFVSSKRLFAFDYTDSSSETFKQAK